RQRASGMALIKTNLAEQAYEAIRNILLDDGRYPPGGKISVEELARELGVSRSPVWAAINRLAADGIVEVRPRDGVFLAGFDLGRLRDLYAVRTELEAMAVRLAAGRTVEAGVLDRMAASLERQRASAAAADVEGYSREALVFHGLLAEASGNVVLTEMLHLLQSRIRGMCLALNRAGANLQRQAAEHAAIMAAVIAGDGASADRDVRAHIPARVAMMDVCRT
ncbi:MAG: GntR family transcriptional regulator, partial [Rhodospirillaceae bacterium]